MKKNNPYAFFSDPIKEGKVTPFYESIGISENGHLKNLKAQCCRCKKYFFRINVLECCNTAICSECLLELCVLSGVNKFEDIFEKPCKFCQKPIQRIRPNVSFAEIVHNPIVSPKEKQNLLDDSALIDKIAQQFNLSKEQVVSIISENDIEDLVFDFSF